MLLGGFREWSDCCDRAISISDIMAAHEIDDFSERNSWHGSECIGLPARIKAAKLCQLERSRGAKAMAIRHFQHEIDRLFALRDENWLAHQNTTYWHAFLLSWHGEAPFLPRPENKPA